MVQCSPSACWIDNILFLEFFLLSLYSLSFLFDTTQLAVKSQTHLILTQTSEAKEFEHLIKKFIALFALSSQNHKTLQLFLPSDCDESSPELKITCPGPSVDFKIRRFPEAA